MIRFIKKWFSRSTNPSSKAESAPADEAATDEQSTDAEVSTSSEQTAPATDEVEIQRRFNEFERRFNERQRELLDYRAKSISWWLALITILLTSFGVIGAIIGYIGFSSLKEIEATAKEHEEAAKSYVEEIKKHRDKAEEIVLSMDAQTVADDPTKARQFIEDVRENPKASSTDKAIAKAVSLQDQGKKEEALKIWRGIADAFEEVDRELAAGAWFSVGYLLELGKPEDAIAAYDQALRLEPDKVAAYNNRGLVKNLLGRHEAAIADYDEAIRLKPDYEKAYLNRGMVKISLSRIDEARQDFEKARDLARKAGDASLVASVEQRLRDLDNREGE